MIAPGGTSATTSADQYTYAPPSPPTITGLSPSSGTTLGNTSVTITGTGFTEAVGVKFGTMVADFTVNSATSVTATTPVGSGTVDVTVTAAGGTSAINAADQYTYIPPPLPRVTAVSPTQGAIGTPVTITGTGFTAPVVVHFGIWAASGVIVNSPTSVTVPAPTSAAGTVDVTVTTGNGTSATSTADQFTYVTAATTIKAVGSLTSKKGTAVTTLAVTPQTVGDVLVVYAELDATGHTVSSVSGGGVSTWTKGVQFAGADGTDEEIWFGKVTTAGSSTITFTWSSSITGDNTEYGAQEFSSSLGATTVWGLDKSGTANGTSSTTVPLPSLTPSSPGELYFGYGEVANTAAASSVSGFTFVVTTDGNIVAFDPTVSGAVSPGAIQSATGLSASVAVLLTASSATPPPAPTVTGVSPGSGTTAGATSVTITGTNFTGATGVGFGTTGATFTVDQRHHHHRHRPGGHRHRERHRHRSGRHLGVNAPADQFTYVTPPAPTVTGSPRDRAPRPGPPRSPSPAPTSPAPPGSDFGTAGRAPSPSPTPPPSPPPPRRAPAP